MHGHSDCGSHLCPKTILLIDSFSCRLIPFILDFRTLSSCCPRKCTFSNDIHPSVFFLLTDSTTMDNGSGGGTGGRVPGSDKVRRGRPLGSGMEWPKFGAFSDSKCILGARLLHCRRFVCTNKGTKYWNTFPLVHQSTSVLHSMGQVCVAVDSDNTDRKDAGFVCVLLVAQYTLPHNSRSGGEKSTHAWVPRYTPLWFSRLP